MQAVQSKIQQLNPQATQTDLQEPEDLALINKDSNLLKTQLVKNLEIWLVSTVKDRLKLAKSEFIQSFLKENENLEIFFQFFMDPYLNQSSVEVRLSYKFKTQFAHLQRSIARPAVLSTRPKFRAHKSFVPKHFESYVYRSFKVMLCFLDSENYARLSKINPQLTALYCNRPN